MSDLVEFMRGRLSEDGAAAKAATPGPWTDAGQRDAFVEQLATTAETSAEDLHLVAEMELCPDHEDRRHADAQHIARHDPARVLREVEATRAILALHTIRHIGTWPVCTHCRPVDPEYTDDLTSEPWPCRTLRHLAAVWSDHPDYRPEWKP